MMGTEAGDGVRTAALPRVLIAAEKSGAGKTMFTCALLSILKDMGFAVSGFKCGPDYIDPMFHRRVLGVPSYNLDSFFSGGNELRYLLGRHGEENKDENERNGGIADKAEDRTAGRKKDRREDGAEDRTSDKEKCRNGTGKRLAVIEGVMGYYDGLGGVTERGSTYELARETDTPVILLVDAKGRSLSALAALKGYLDYQADSRICGVIFNRLAPGLYPGLKAAAEREFGAEGENEAEAPGSRKDGGKAAGGRKSSAQSVPAEAGGDGPEAQESGSRRGGRRRLRVLGYVPELPDFSLESRHLGLVRPEEIPGFQRKLAALAERIRPGLDLDALLALMEEARPLSWRPQAIPPVRRADGTRPRIAVAMDEAFCFYYADNLETLEQMGAELVRFSPLRDLGLPAEICGLYLGGGYPELYAKGLAENGTMRESIRRALAAGLPCIAECGGYLYLKETLCDPEGNEWPMAGVLPGGSRNFGRLRRFGYGMMTVKQAGLLGEAGLRFPAHEFHHWDSEENGAAFRFEKPVGTRKWDCGYHSDTLYAGFPHLYFYGHFPYGFLKRAAAWHDSRQRKGAEHAEDSENRTGARAGSAGDRSKHAEGGADSAGDRSEHAEGGADNTGDRAAGMQPGA